jgi:hypothetical protein
MREGKKVSLSLPYPPSRHQFLSERPTWKVEFEQTENNKGIEPIIEELTCKDVGE